MARGRRDSLGLSAYDSFIRFSMPVYPGAFCQFCAVCLEGIDDRFGRRSVLVVVICDSESQGRETLRSGRRGLRRFFPRGLYGLVAAAFGSSDGADAQGVSRFFDPARTGGLVPRISYFYGIGIWMHWKEGHHGRPHFHGPSPLPWAVRTSMGRPHFHVYYAEHEASLDLAVELIAGELPRRQLRLVQAWP